MVSQIEGLEKEGAARKMPVKMYFENAFSHVLSDALFELERKQLKIPDGDYSVKGQIEFVAEEILNHLPKW